MRKRLLALASLAALLTAGSSHAEPLAGYDRFPVKADHRAVLVPASIWYPAAARTYPVPIGDNVLFVGTKALVGAAVEAGKHPLILLSHGSGGNMDSLGWLSSQLALRGAMVLAVNHPGTTSGDSSPRRTPRIDERAKDLSAALDTLLADPTFGPLVDTTRISALGFSLGGTAVLNLVGGHFERVKYRDYCRNLPTQPDCDFFRKGGVDFDNLPEAMEADVRDGRVRSVVAVEPGMTDALSPESVKTMTLPVLLFNFGAPTPWRGVDVSETGSDLVARLTDVTYETIRPASHFTFLPICKPGAAELLEQDEDDPICTDPEGTDRAKVHAEVIAAVARFLGLSSEVKQADLNHQ